MRADQRPSQPSQPFAPADGRRFEFIEPQSPADDALGSTDVPLTFYVTRSTFAALQREAEVARASDWRAHAQRKLDDALARQALPLTPEAGGGAPALRRYPSTWSRSNSCSSCSRPAWRAASGFYARASPSCERMRRAAHPAA